MTSSEIYTEQMADLIPTLNIVNGILTIADSQDISSADDNDNTSKKAPNNQGKLKKTLNNTTNIRYSPSPNFNQRPVDTNISLLVIHNISLPPGQFGGDHIEHFFCNRLEHDAHPYFANIKDLEVSAHCLIKRDGSVIQFVNFNDRAWHAGRSEFEGQPECNDYSIGIELEGTDHQAYTTQQYTMLVAVTQAIQHSYPEIDSSRITGHSHIAPERKTDPGPAFDWSYFKSRL